MMQAAAVVVNMGMRQTLWMSDDAHVLVSGLQLMLTHDCCNVTRNKQPMSINQPYSNKKPSCC